MQRLMPNSHRWRRRDEAGECSWCVVPSVWRCTGQNQFSFEECRAIY